MGEKQIYEALAAYEDASATPGGADIRKIVGAYPEARGEVIDFASYKFVFEHGAIVNADVTTADFENRALARAAAIREEMMAAGVKSKSALGSVVEAAKQRGLTVPALARRLRLSPLEVTKLNQRLIRAESIPSSLIRSLADALGRSTDAIIGYLRLPPTLSAQASYKADAAPRVPERVDFNEALESSRALSEADKAYWRTQAERNDVGG
jgi:hypothetical protein